jgi:hypothetical protein
VARDASVGKCRASKGVHQDWLAGRAANSLCRSSSATFQDDDYFNNETQNPSDSSSSVGDDLGWQGEFRVCGVNLIQ